ncbi:MAG TPA: PAS domain-containing protein [Allosphingosinicella sp.]|nr:PAS domain-containing protein [Allosphingosinicella sp.]
MTARPDPSARAAPAPEELVGLALNAAALGKAALAEALGSPSAPIYVTDAEGYITFFNQACIGFTGRRPEVGKDRWCVTWRLYGTDGAPLAHEDCPMAVAIRDRRAVRGACAVAERPDGTRVTFVPYPTPLLDETGALDGAVNILIDVTEARQAAELAEQAERCRRLSRASTDQQVIDTLLAMADEYDEKARRLRRD